jgi:hypothetical protein
MGHTFIIIENEDVKDIVEFTDREVERISEMVKDSDCGLNGVVADYHSPLSKCESPIAKTSNTVYHIECKTGVYS